MLWGGHVGELEVRRAPDGATRLRGRFPYGKPAVLSDGGKNGRPRKEIIAPRAFSYRINDPKEDIHLLVGHDYGQPLASRSAGTLDLKDTDQALIFTARITPELERVSWVQDILAALSAGLVGGISPGFRMPPERAVAKSEQVTEEPMDPARGMYGALIRTIFAALLYELSLVTRPAYDETQIEARDWAAAKRHAEAPDAALKRALQKWRA